MEKCGRSTWAYEGTVSRINKSLSVFPEQWTLFWFLLALDFIWDWFCTSTCMCMHEFPLPPPSTKQTTNYGIPPWWIEKGSLTHRQRDVVGDEDTRKEGMVGGRTNYGGSVTGIPVEQSLRKGFHVWWTCSSSFEWTILGKSRRGKNLATLRSQLADVTNDRCAVRPKIKPT